MSPDRSSSPELPEQSRLRSRPATEQQSTDSKRFANEQFVPDVSGVQSQGQVGRSKSGMVSKVVRFQDALKRLATGKSADFRTEQTALSAGPSAERMGLLGQVCLIS